MSPTAPAAVTWGNPEAVTFAKNHIRVVNVDGTKLWVHRLLVPLVERVLHDLSARNLVAEQAEGHPLIPDGRGLLLIVGGLSSAQVAGVMERYGFASSAADVYVWTGTAEEAKATADALDEQADAEYAAPALPTAAEGGVPATDDPTAAETPRSGSGPRSFSSSDEEWDDGMPGHREITAGAVGRDVLFIQAFLYRPRTGILSGDDCDEIVRFQSMNNMDPSGEIRAETWRRLIGGMRPRLYPGDAGKWVRVLQAGLVSAGRIDRDTEITSRYGVALAKIVRELQADLGMRPTAKVGTIEWENLIGAPPV